MKYLNNYKIFEDKEDIDAICAEYNIKHYTINTDGSIDVDGPVDIRYKRLGKFPLRFKKVRSYFYCQNNELTSLEGCPKYINGDFSCSFNKITSLEGCPEYVDGSFYCSFNPIWPIVDYFISRKDKNNLIELFNYYDIVQDMNVIYDRLKYFYDSIDVKITDKKLEEIEIRGYKIIY